VAGRRSRPPPKRLQGALASSYKQFRRLSGSWPASKLVHDSVALFPVSLSAIILARAPQAARAPRASAAARRSPLPPSRPPRPPVRRTERPPLARLFSSPDWAESQLPRFPLSWRPQPRSLHRPAGPCCGGLVGSTLLRCAADNCSQQYGTAGLFRVTQTLHLKLFSH
jgi:hypothetical protein